MKKFPFLIVAAAMLGMSFSSCDKEKEDDSNVNASIEGRWDGYRQGDEIGQEMQSMTLITKGNEVDVYIIPWGDHLKGTFTYNGDSLSFSFKNENAYDALIKYSQDSWSWSISDGALDPETLELAYTDELPYRWYVMDANQFNTDVDFLSSFAFKAIDENTAVGGPMNLQFTKKK